MAEFRDWLRIKAQKNQFPISARNGQAIPDYPETLALYLEEEYGGFLTPAMLRMGQFPNPSSVQRVIADEFKRLQEQETQ